MINIAETWKCQLGYLWPRRSGEGLAAARTVCLVKQKSNSVRLKATDDAVCSLQ